MTEPVFKISNALLEAYVGTYEDELRIYHDQVPEFRELSFKNWARRIIITGWEGCPGSILGDTPEERLRVYLEWNGILGFTQTIYSIAIGRLA